MTQSPKWLTKAMMDAIHDQSLIDFGGASGTRNSGLLESAIDRPRNLHAYVKDVTIPRLAAAYCFAIVKNHPFVDGNKRAGLLAGNAFLALNGYRFQPEETEIVHMILALAEGAIGEDELASWFSENSEKL